MDLSWSMNSFMALLKKTKQQQKNLGEANSLANLKTYFESFLLNDQKNIQGH